MSHLKEINPNLVITDNTLLTDAAIVFQGLRQENSVLNSDRFENWKRFLEGAVLHERMFADDKIFRYQEHIRYLSETFGGCISGVDPPDTDRELILKEAGRIYQQVLGEVIAIAQEADRQDLRYQVNRTSHHLQRALFYMGLSQRLGLAYRPSIARERVFNRVFENKQGTKITVDMVASSLMQKLIEHAVAYAENIQRFGGPQLIIATLPPITNLVIHAAKKTGSWSEAIIQLRESPGVKSFRNWCEDVANSLKNGDAKAIKKLRSINQFMEGWGMDPDEGVYHKTIEIGISQLPKLLNVSVVELPDVEISGKIRPELPVLWRPYHLLFLNQVFRSAVQPELDLVSLRKIKS